MAMKEIQSEMLRLTVDVERNSFADGGWDVVGRDAHVRADAGTRDSRQVQHRTFDAQH